MDRVLIIEDCASTAKLMGSLLAAQLQGPVDVARDLAEAGRYLAAAPPDLFLVVADLVLPDAPDGAAVDLAQAHGLPVVVATSTMDTATRERMLSRQVADYVLKRNRGDFEYLAHCVARLAKNRLVKVLAVDDSKTVLSILRQVLQAQLFQVLEARNGEEALTVLDAHPDVRLVVTDSVMPTMDGMALVQALRSRHSMDQMAIVALSAHSTKALVPQFLKSGANDYLMKPFNREEFVTRISNCLDHMEMVEQIRTLMNHDYLTGLYNRMFLFEAGRLLLGNARRNQQPVAAAMIDIDNFKSINDSLGHEAGDHYIVRLAKGLERHFRRHAEIVARLGGDEFAVLTVYDDRDRLVNHLQQVQRLVVDGIEPFPGHTGFRLSVSIGVCTEAHDTVGEMLNAADRLMYRAKREGKGRVIAGP